MAAVYTVIHSNIQSPTFSNPSVHILLPTLQICVRCQLLPLLLHMLLRSSTHAAAQHRVPDASVATAVLACVSSVCCCSVLGRHQPPAVQTHKSSANPQGPPQSAFLSSVAWSECQATLSRRHSANPVTPWHTMHSCAGFTCRALSIGSPTPNHDSTAGVTPEEYLHGKQP